MEELDLANFTWINKETKQICSIYAITEFKDYDVVVYKCRNGKVEIQTVSDFCDTHNATYRIN